MESNGVEGNIMVSETTKTMLEKDKVKSFAFELLKTVEIKGSETPMNGYLILKQMGESQGEE